jgi:hypothetical protein
MSSALMLPSCAPEVAYSGGRGGCKWQSRGYSSSCCQRGTGGAAGWAGADRGGGVGNAPLLWPASAGTRARWRGWWGRFFAERLQLLGLAARRAAWLAAAGGARQRVRRQVPGLHLIWIYSTELGDYADFWALRSRFVTF